MISNCKRRMQEKIKPIAPRKVVNLYSMTGVTPMAGIQDYTEGIYQGDPFTDYAIAQKNQHNFLLDEIGAQEGFRLLDIGCGLGTLLETAKERGVSGIGITISEGQVTRCRAKGLDVRLLNYQYLPDEFGGRFDGIIANGSLEHFCQPEDASQGRQDEVYREMFEIFNKLLDHASAYQRVVTTAIHFSDDHVDPKNFLKNPFLQLFDEVGFHAAVLHRGYGGYYPVKGQLEKCATSFFTLVKEIDGTEDYLLTSEHWCRQYKNALGNNPVFRRKLIGHFLKRPMHTVWVVASFVGIEAWPWQFRGNNSSARLYRHTWQRIKE